MKPWDILLVEWQGLVIIALKLIIATTLEMFFREKVTLAVWSVQIILVLLLGTVIIRGQYILKMKMLVVLLEN